MNATATAATATTKQQQPPFFVLASATLPLRDASPPPNNQPQPSTSTAPPPRLLLHSQAPNVDQRTSSWHRSVCSTYATQWAPFDCWVHDAAPLLAGSGSRGAASNGDHAGDDVGDGVGGDVGDGGGDGSLEFNINFAGNHSSCSIWGGITSISHASGLHVHQHQQQEKFDSNNNSSSSSNDDDDDDDDIGGGDDGDSQGLLVVVMFQEVNSVYPNTPDPLRIESCGVILCIPSSGEHAASERIHCKRQWATAAPGSSPGLGMVFASKPALTIVHNSTSSAASQAPMLPLVAQPLGEPPHNLHSAVVVQTLVAATFNNATRAHANAHGQSAASKDRGEAPVTTLLTSVTSQPLAAVTLYRTS